MSTGRLAIGLSFEGDTRDVIRSFPDGPRQRIGHTLRKLQDGEIPQNIRPMPSVGKWVFEIKTADERTWYRVLYLTRIEDKIYVLHAFEKSSKKTEKYQLETAKKRLSQVRTRLKG